MSAVVQLRPPVIPVGVSHTRLVRHSRRVAALVQELGQGGVDGFSRSELSVLQLGIGMSWYGDLRLFGPVGSHTEKLAAMVMMRAAIWPGDEEMAFRRMWSAFRYDAPRYHPAPAEGDGLRCPYPGPRGGRHRGDRRVHWVTDESTGAWEWRNICRVHLPEARERGAAAPAPAPNTGGVLLRVFPNSNIDRFYQWATGDQYAERDRVGVDADPPATRPVLRLVGSDNTEGV